MKRGKRQPPSFEVPPATMAKLLEVAALMLVADAIRQAARQGRTMVIEFPKGEPTVKIIPPPSKPEAT